MGMIRKTKGLLVAGVFVLFSCGSVSALVEARAVGLVNDLDGAIFRLKDNKTGKYVTTAPDSALYLRDREEGISQFFKGKKVSGGRLVFQCLTNGNNLQVFFGADQIFNPNPYRIALAANKNQGSWEMMRPEGTLNDLQIFNPTGDAYLTGGSFRLYYQEWFFKVEAKASFDGKLWFPALRSGVNQEPPLSFTVEIVEASPALLKAKIEAEKEAAAKAFELAKAEAAKAEALQKKTADDLRVINAALERKIKALESEKVSDDAQLTRISEILTSKDKNQLAELKKFLSIKTEEIVQTEQAKKDGQVEKAKEDAKVDAKVEQLKIEAKDAPSHVEAAAEKVAQAKIELEKVKTKVEEVKQEIKEAKVEEAKAEAKAEAEKPKTREVKVETAKEEAKEAVAAETPAKKVATKPVVKKTVAAKKTTKAPAKKVAAKPTKKVAAKGKAISRDKAGRPAGKKKLAGKKRQAKKTIKRKVSAKKSAKTPVAKAKTPANASVKTAAPVAKAPVAAMPVAVDAAEPEETDTEETEAEETEAEAAAK